VSQPVAEPEGAAAARAEEERHVAGWRIVGTKELADHVTSIRFVILVAVVALAALVMSFVVPSQRAKAGRNPETCDAIELSGTSNIHFGHQGSSILFRFAQSMG
jgi:ABC-type transport system involved in multi-copper enzyme maturation permease subunit